MGRWVDGRKRNGGREGAKDGARQTWQNRLVNAQMDGHTDEWVEQKMDERLNGNQLDEQANGRIGEINESVPSCRLDHTVHEIKMIFHVSFSKRHRTGAGKEQLLRGSF